MRSRARQIVSVGVIRSMDRSWVCMHGAIIDASWRISLPIRLAPKGLGLGAHALKPRGALDMLFREYVYKHTQRLCVSWRICNVGKSMKGMCNLAEFVINLVS